MAKSETPVNTKAFLLGTPGYQAPELLLGKSPVVLVMSKALEFCFGSWRTENFRPCAEQHSQVYLSFFVAFMCVLIKLNVTFTGLHVELGSCRRPPHHPTS